jgi:hypothetical protein
MAGTAMRAHSRMGGRLAGRKPPVDQDPANAIHCESSAA